LVPLIALVLQQSRNELRGNLGSLTYRELGCPLRVYDPKDPRNGAGNRHCAHLIRNAEGNFNWAKHKLANSE
jgi:hypothetical protein